MHTKYFFFVYLCDLHFLLWQVQNRALHRPTKKIYIQRTRHHRTPLTADKLVELLLLLHLQLTLEFSSLSSQSSGEKVCISLCYLSKIKIVQHYRLNSKVLSTLCNTLTNRCYLNSNLFIKFAQTRKIFINLSRHLFISFSFSFSKV